MNNITSEMSRIDSDGFEYIDKIGIGQFISNIFDSSFEDGGFNPNKFSDSWKDQINKSEYSLPEINDCK